MVKLPSNTLESTYKMVIYSILYFSLWFTAADLTDGTEYKSMLIFIVSNEAVMWLYGLINSGEPMFVVNNSMTNSNTNQSGDRAQSRQALHIDERQP